MSNTKRAQSVTEDRPEFLGFLGHPRAVGVGLVPETAGISAVRYPLGLVPSDALELLERARVHAALAHLETVAAVATARDAGLSWQSIAQALGEPRQTVESRYRPAVASAAVVVSREGVSA